MRQKKGTITSTKMTGTVTVTVDSLAFHPKYKKRYKVSKKFLADAAGQDLHEGDLVLIGECKPLSKLKHFKVLEILKKAAEVDEVVTEEGVEKAIHREKVAPTTKKKAQDDSEQEEPSQEQL